MVKTMEFVKGIWFDEYGVSIKEPYHIRFNDIYSSTFKLVCANDVLLVTVTPKMDRMATIELNGNFRNLHFNSVFPKTTRSGAEEYVRQWLKKFEFAHRGEIIARI